MNEGMMIEGPNSDEWETPPWLFKALDAEFGFTLDVGANRKNALLATWVEDISALPTYQDGYKIFCNPPYSKIDTFISYLINKESPSVLLLPARTDTNWFQRIISGERKAELRWFRKRIRFYLGGKESDSPRFSSFLCIWR